MSDHEITPGQDPGDPLPQADVVVAQAPRPSAGPKIAVALAVAVLVAGTAVVFAFRSGAGGTLEDHVPADAALFARVSLRAPADQRAGLDALLDRLPPEQRAIVDDGLDGALDDLFSKVGVSWSQDVKGWIGQEVGVAIGDVGPEVFVTGPPVIAMASVRDEGAARATLSDAQGLSTDGAFVVEGGVAYISQARSTIDAFIADAEQASLVDNADYVAARDEFGGGLAFLWADARDLAPALGALGAGGVGSAASGAFALGLFAEPAALVVEGRSLGDEQGSGGVDQPIVEGTDANQLGSLTLFDLGAAVEALATFAQTASAFGDDVDLGNALDPLDQLGLDLVDDLAAWMHGEATFVVSGFAGALPDAGLVFEVTDEEALDRTLRALERGARRLGESFDLALRARTIDGDLAIEVDGFGLFTRRGNGRLAIATRPLLAEELLTDASAPLRDEPVYQRAIGTSEGAVTFQAFMRLDIIGSLFTAFLPAEERAAAANLTGVLAAEAEAFVVRTTTGADGATFRMALTFTE